MRRTIFTEVKFIKGDLYYHFLFWLLLYILHWVNFAFTKQSDFEEGYSHDSIIVANLVMLSTIPFAYFHTYILLSKTIGNQRIGFNFSLALYFSISIVLAILSSFFFDFLYDLELVVFDNPHINEHFLPSNFNFHPFGKVDENLQNMYWSRNVPEAFFNMYLLTGLVYIRKWYNSSELLRQKNEKQRMELEKMRLVKDTLSQGDIIHTMMNSFFAQTDALKDIAEHLTLEDKTKLEKIINLQEDIGKLQRFRYSLIKDNEDLVLVEYELKALIWMRNIIASKNTNIVFQEDIEAIEEGKYLIVPSIMTELLWNAYKHSQFMDKSKKVTIVIELAIIDQKIKFYIQNPIGDAKNKGTQGGLNILQKRLDIEYGKDNYVLNMPPKSNQIHPELFIIALQLPIKKI